MKQLTTLLLSSAILLLCLTACSSGNKPATYAQTSSSVSAASNESSSSAESETADSSEESSTSESSLSESSSMQESSSSTELSTEPSTEEDRAVGVFDFDSKTVLLNSGYTMPIMGLGTYALDYETCVNSVMALLENGGRLIDTAYDYSGPN